VRADEAAQVAWLAATTFPLACPPGTAVDEVARHIATHLTPAAFAAWAASDEHALLAVVQGGEIAGYALLHLGELDGSAESRAVLAATRATGPAVELSKIYAHPLAIGTGASAALMRGAIDAAATLAAGHGHAAPLPLWLGTNAGNLRAQAFYRKHGFEVVGTRTYDVGGGVHDDVVMLHRN
jgi:GNAT superfamily N-acetyltransferase